MSSLPLDPGTYALDTAHSQFTFQVTHLGITPVIGMFSEFSGSLVVGEDAASSSLEIAVQMASVSSGNAGRDSHLQAPDFFDSVAHPQMTFRSTSLSGEGDNWTIDGELTVKGVAQQVRLNSRFTGRSVFPMDKKEHIGATANGTMSRLVGGVGPAIPASMLSDEITLSVAVQLIKNETLIKNE